MNAPRALRITAGAELATLVILLVNLVTAHWPQISSLMGPTHGSAYLLVIVLTAQRSRVTATRLAALVPAIGGFLVLRRLAAEAATPAPHQPR
ncbi:DUF3817 domain-containing protein [Saccharopolyspora sp. NPDC000359]|uniref:DUF3817 domain-containing protein n=1 Tax=Saccharopolyspora sp. NPDC000359 TaxID=3154251 RepID=UPI0033256054